MGNCFSSSGKSILVFDATTDNTELDAKKNEPSNSGQSVLARFLAEIF